MGIVQNQKEKHIIPSRHGMQNLYLNKLDKSTQQSENQKKQLHTYWFISFTGWWYTYPSEKYE
jgi:hypothetical protein